jgi:hypothetical protein
MTSLTKLAAATLLTIVALGGGQARANTCQTDKLTCPTAMPVDGYCECRSHGEMEGGTVVKTPPPHVHYNATPGGCGVNPAAPGCR